MIKTVTSQGNIHFHFISILRFVAVILITWDHLVGTWVYNNNISWMPLTILQEYITKPLGIIQDFGFIGISLIFLTSGFLVTHVAQKEERKEFFLKRFFRIYPPLIVSTIVLIIIYWIFYLITNTATYVQNLNLKDILFSFTLLNYFAVPQNAVNGVAWILVIEWLFYLAILLILPTVRKKPLFASTSILLFSLIIAQSARYFGDNFYLFAVSTSYIPFLVIGQITYYYWAKKITKVNAIVLSVFALCCLYIGFTIHTDSLIASNSYLISFIYAYIIFVLSFLLRDKIKVGRISAFFSKVSYSFYLNQAISLIFISLFFPFIGFECSLVLSFFLLSTIAYLSWRFVEEPARRTSVLLANKKISNYFHIRRK